MNSLKQINYLINIAKNSSTGNYVILTLEGLKEIKKDLEILSLIIKWQKSINFNNKSMYSWYLTDTEFKIMVDELEKIENYIVKYKCYTPKAIRKEGDSNVN